MNYFEKEDYEKSFENKNIMVTGGLGFIGSNLVHKLTTLNPKKIIIIDALIPSHGGDIKNVDGIKDQLEIPFIENGGLNIDDDRIKDYLDVDYIFNLAGSTNHLNSKKNPIEDLKINLISHVKFLETCKNYLKENTNKKFKILFSSTRDVYGKAEEKYLPIKEDFLVKSPADPQGIHNHSAEYHHLWYGKTFRIPIVCLRLTNTYGPRQKINNPGQGFLGHFIYKSLKNEEIELWGGGESIRDFNYVEDVIEAMLLAIVSEKTDYKIYNLGSFMRKNNKYQEIGNNICSVKEIAKNIINIIDRGSYKEVLYPEENKKIEPGHIYLDATKIYDDIGWYPKINLDEGLKRTIYFYKQNIHYLDNSLKENNFVDHIVFLDLNEHHKSMNSEIDKAIKKVISNSNFILGEELEKFENEFANYCEKKYGVGVGNGTDAIKIALMALDVKENDEVIIPVNTAIPTAMAIKDAGAEICFVDCDDDYLIDVNDIEKKINNKTKFIIPVHLYGKACDMDRIFEIANRYGLKVIEDCCQAHGSLYKGKKVPIGEIGCFSFYPSKNLGALGDGGMIVSNDEKIYNKLKLLRNYGQSSKYNADILGVNSRLDEIQAAILRVKLKYLDEFNEKRKNIAKLYDNLLKLNHYLVTTDYNNENNYHLYVIRVKNRDDLLNYLKSKNIATLIHYPVPLHMQKSFSYLEHTKNDFPNAERFSREILSLPMYPEMKEENAIKVCKEINDYYLKYAY